jgi:hypothetical protein
MTIDVAALPVAGQTMKYIRATWEVTRDGGAAGPVSIPSQQLPAGAVILGTALVSTDALTDIGTSTVQLMLGQDPISAKIALASVNAAMEWLDDAMLIASGGSWPITLLVEGDGFSAATVYIYVFYV